MSIDKDTLLSAIREDVEKVISLRRELHAFPEIQYTEVKTAEKIRSVIGATAAEIKEPYLETDTVALLYGENREGKNITLRADIDALPISDKCGKPWHSGIDGKSHACGHDGHTAILLGTLMVAEKLRKHFNGSIRFVFQPAEEVGLGGKYLGEKGLLADDPKPAGVFALHGWPGYPEGMIASRPGVFMAAADDFSLRVSGKGGHSALPHLTADPVVVSSAIIQGFQTIISRQLSPLETAVISVGSINGGTTTNAIPEHVYLEGTVRYIRESLKGEIRKRMESVIRGCCSASGADYLFEYEEGYIPLVNDPGMVDFCRAAAEKYLGLDKWIEPEHPTMGAEDFAFYLKQVPGAFLWLGLGEKSPGLHTPAFDFNDNVIEQGILMLSGLIFDFLG